MKITKNEHMRDKQVALEFPISRPTVWRWAREGKLTAIKVSSGVTVFLRSELEALFNGGAK